MSVSRVLKSSEQAGEGRQRALPAWRWNRMLLGMLSVFWGASLGSGLPAQSHLFTFPQEQAEALVRPRAAGDVNGDGYDDIMILFWRNVPMGADLRAYSGRDGRLLWEVKDVWVDAVGLGDLNRDGYDDVVTFGNAKTRAELWFVSGKTGKIFRKRALQNLGAPDPAVRAGDVNADGYQDLLVGDPGWGLFQSGHVAVISGKDGGRLHDLYPSIYGTKFFGQSVAAAGDTNEDGYADFLVHMSPTVGGVYVELYSGKTGQVLKSYASTAWQWLGTSIGEVGDINGDGKQDYAIGGATYFPTIWFMQIRSGAKKDKHKVLLTIRDYYPNLLGMGERVAQVGDVNGDGTPDLAVGGQDYQVNGKKVGSIEYRSGKDGKFLRRIVGPGDKLTFGTMFWNIGDVNGDGNPDIAVQTWDEAHWRKPPAKIKAFVFSGAPMDLWSDTHRVSLASQGKQVLRLDAGPGHAGSAYFVLGSLSGIKPGLKLGGLTLPLQPDAWFWLTAGYANSALLQGSLGVLDKKGQATCTLTAIPGLPTALIGNRVDHAYVLFKNGRFTKTSHWVPLLFEK